MSEVGQPAWSGTHGLLVTQAACMARPFDSQSGVSRCREYVVCEAELLELSQPLKWLGVDHRHAHFGVPRQLVYRAVDVF